MRSDSYKQRLKNFYPNDVIENENALSSFATLNTRFGYFPSSENFVTEFIKYFNFFTALESQEKSGADEAELYKRAYISTVVFGGTSDPTRSLQKLLTDGYPKSEKPLHDIFSSIDLPPKSHRDVNLALWRQLFNGTQIKKALQLFRLSSDIAKKFAQIGVVTIEFKFPKTVTIGSLYIFPKRNDDAHYGYQFIDEYGLLCSGMIEKNQLADVITTNGMTLSIQQKEKEAEVCRRIENTASHTVSRTASLDDIKTLEGQLTYQRFNESVELATLCRTYKLSENDFNKCLSLLSQHKLQDALPSLHIRGSELIASEKDKSVLAEYHFVKLPITDPRAFILGKITNCCQSIGGESEDCVIDGWKDSDKGFYVLLKGPSNANPFINHKIDYDKFEIVGQGYAWISKLHNLVFDSWENLRPEFDDEKANIFLKAFAQRVVSDASHHIVKVNIGTGGRTPRTLVHEHIKAEAIYGYQYPDSKIQSSLAFQIKKPSSDSIQKILSDLTSDEIIRIVEYAPETAYLENFLTVCSQHANGLDWLRMIANESDHILAQSFLTLMIQIYIRFLNDFNHVLQYLKKDQNEKLISKITLLEGLFCYLSETNALQPSIVNLFSDLQRDDHAKFIEKIGAKKIVAAITTKSFYALRSYLDIACLLNLLNAMNENQLTAFIHDTRFFAELIYVMPLTVTDFILKKLSAELPIDTVEKIVTAISLLPYRGNRIKDLIHDAKIRSVLVIKLFCVSSMNSVDANDLKQLITIIKENIFIKEQVTPFIEKSLLTCIECADKITLQDITEIALAFDGMLSEAFIKESFLKKLQANPELILLDDLLTAYRFFPLVFHTLGGLEKLAALTTPHWITSVLITLSEEDKPLFCKALFTKLPDITTLQTLLQKIVYDEEQLRDGIHYSIWFANLFCEQNSSLIQSADDFIALLTFPTLPGADPLHVQKVFISRYIYLVTDYAQLKEVLSKFNRVDEKQAFQETILNAITDRIEKILLNDQQKEEIKEMLTMELQHKFFPCNDWEKTSGNPLRLFNLPTSDNTASPTSTVDENKKPH